VDGERIMDSLFDPSNIKISSGIKPPKNRGWAKNLMLSMKVGEHVDLPDPFKCQSVYSAAKTLKYKVRWICVNSNKYRLWRIK
jgi:hypothetical protein